jgi:hypothetical protein
MLSDIWGKVRQVSTGVAFLVAGADEQRAELHAVTDPEGARPLDSPGFGAIGIGGCLAMTALYQNQQHIKHMDLPRAVYAVYEAKKEADRDARVGKATDMAVISAGGNAEFLDEKAISNLESFLPMSFLHDSGPLTRRDRVTPAHGQDTPPHRPNAAEGPGGRAPPAGPTGRSHATGGASGGAGSGIGSFTICR